MENIFEIIAQQHNDSAAVLFTQFGYGNLPVTGETIEAMAITFGDAFMKPLDEAIAKCYVIVQGLPIKMRS